MPWVRFTADYDFRPKPGVTIAYKDGWVGLVTAACAKNAVAAGKAERTSKPKPEQVDGAE